MTTKDFETTSRRTALTALASLWVAGCAGLGAELERPQVRLLGLALLDASADSQHFRVDLEVANPNVVPVPVERVTFNVRVAGGGVLDGRSTEPFTLPAGGSETVGLEVTTDLVSSVSRLLALLQGPESSIPYDLDGLLTLSRGLKRTFPFSARGEVPLAMPAGLR